MRDCGIYKITVDGSPKVYIGQSSDLKKRMYDHQRALREGTHRNRHLQRSYAKYGGKHRFKVLFYCEEADLDDMEVRAIKAYDSFRAGFNLTEGGEGARGFKHSDVARQKIGEARKGRKCSEETRKKMSEAQKGRKGKPLSEEHKRKLGEVLKGRKHSDATKKKMSETHKGKKLSDDHRRKLSESHKGNKHSDETRKKMSEAHKGREGKPRSAETRQKISEAVKRYWRERKAA